MTAQAEAAPRPVSAEGGPRSVAFNLFFYAATFLCALVAWLVSLTGARRALRGMLRVWSRIALWGVRNILGARVEVLGLERLPPGGPALIVPKHQSELDAVVLLGLFPDLGAIAMKELENYPFLGRIVRGLGYILVAVNAGDRQKRTEAVVEGARRVHAEGRPVLIYPEGELMSLGAAARYRAGAWRIYDALGVPATPVAQSLGVIWPRREWRKQPGATGALEFLDPIAPGLGQAEFMAELERRIETRTMELIKAHARPALAALARERKARGAANDEAAP